MEEQAGSNEAPTAPAKRGRGRPHKNPQNDGPSSGKRRRSRATPSPPHKRLRRRPYKVQPEGGQDNSEAIDDGDDGPTGQKDSHIDGGANVGSPLFARPQITFEEAESLLPAKPDRDLWSDVDEAWLQATWTARDDEILDAHMERNCKEYPLWKTMLHLFGQHPYMLFRYGLKHDGSRHEVRLNGEKVFTAYPPLMPVM
jgi:hypothetical protein